MCHGFRERDLCINVEPAEEALDGLEQVDESVIACANILRRLIHSDVTGHVHGNSEKRRTSSKTPKAAKIAFAGGNTYKMLIKKKIGNEILWAYQANTLTKDGI